MEIENLIKLVDKVSASGLTAFCYEEDGVKVQMTRKSGKTAAAAENVMAAAGPDVTEENMADDHVKTVVSPLVGIFYSAPSEGDEDYVHEGDTVKKGQVLAIVEAMKLMNEIESDYDGEIAEVLVKNGQTVEYGQPLFTIR